MMPILAPVSRIARAVRQAMLSGFRASSPRSVFKEVGVTGKMATPVMPRSAAREAMAVASLMLWRYTPGMAEMGSGSVPSCTKMGKIKFPG